MAHGYLVQALHIFLRPSHPCSLDPLVSAMSASQQLPLVQLLASLLEAPKDDKDPLPPGDVRLGSLPYCACVAEALASRCLAKGRKLLCQNSQQPLLGAALRQVKKAATEAAESHSGVWLAARQRCSALDLVAALLTDAAEELGKALGSGTGASASATPLRREQSSRRSHCGGHGSCAATPARHAGGNCGCGHILQQQQQGQLGGTAS